MAILVGLQHVTHYKYDRPIAVGPQTIRLRPAPHCRTQVASYSLKVNSQVLAGAGAAISIFDGAHVKLNLSDGPVFDQSSVVLPDSAHLSYHTVRNSFRVAFKFDIKDLIVIDGSDYLQNSFSIGSDYIIRSTTNLSLKINKWLQLTSSLLFNEQKRTESTNLLFTYGIKIDKSF